MKFLLLLMSFMVKCRCHWTRRGPGFSSPEWQNIRNCGQ